MGLLRQFFGPSQAEIWSQLAVEIGAHYETGFWTGTKVQAEYAHWLVTLDTYTVNSGKHSHTYTRLRAPYFNKDGFQFGIYRKSIFTGVAKMFGMQDITIGHPEFDEEFVIQGNNEDKLRALFKDEHLRGLINMQPQLGLWVRPDQGWFSRIYPEGVDELYYQTHGVLRDLDQLKLLFDLFSVVLDQLCAMDSAYAKNPGVRL
jgi:hypothetical protein